MSRFVLFFDGNSVNPIIRCSEYQKEEFLKDFKENEDEYKGIIKYILKNKILSSITRIAQKKVKIEKENRFLQTVLHNPNVYGLIYVMKQENDKWKIDGFNCRYADDDIYTINYSNFTPR